MDKKKLKQYFFIAVLVIVICFIVKHFTLLEKLLGLAYSAISPLLLGAIIAYIFNIILNAFEKHYFPKSNAKSVLITKRPVCLVLSFVCVIVIFVFILNIVIPEIIYAIRLISSEIPPLIDNWINNLIKKLDEYPDIQKEAMDILNEFDIKSVDWATITEKTAAFLKNGLMGLISSAIGFVGSVANTVTNIVIAVIFAIYLLLRKDKLLNDINRFQNAFINENINRKVNILFKTADDTFKSFFIGQFFEAIILGCLCFVGMKLLGLPYAAMSGVLVGVTALIPIVGAFLGAGISALIIFTENPMHSLIFLVFLIILQQLEGNIIYPKVVGNSIGLPGIWVLAAVTIGGGLWGIMGMLIGVPLVATAYKLIFEYLEKREEKMGIKQKNVDSLQTPISEKNEVINKSKKIVNKNFLKKDSKQNTNKK